MERRRFRRFVEGSLETVVAAGAAPSPVAAEKPQAVTASANEAPGHPRAILDSLRCRAGALRRRRAHRLPREEVQAALRQSVDEVMNAVEDHLEEVWDTQMGSWLKDALAAPILAPFSSRSQGMVPYSAREAGTLGSGVSGEAAVVRHCGPLEEGIEREMQRLRQSISFGQTLDRTLGVVPPLGLADVEPRGPTVFMDISSPAMACDNASDISAALELALGSPRAPKQSSAGILSDQELVKQLLGAAATAPSSAQASPRVHLYSPRPPSQPLEGTELLRPMPWRSGQMPQLDEADECSEQQQRGRTPHRTPRGGSKDATEAQPVAKAAAFRLDAQDASTEASAAELASRELTREYELLAPRDFV